MRYSQERRLAARGAVNAVPESCSAYKPYATRCGELRPTGKAPGKASVVHSLAKPLIMGEGTLMKWSLQMRSSARKVAIVTSSPLAQFL